MDKLRSCVMKIEKAMTFIVTEDDRDKFTDKCYKQIATVPNG